MKGNIDDGGDLVNAQFDKDNLTEIMATINSDISPKSLSNKL